MESTISRRAALASGSVVALLGAAGCLDTVTESSDEDGDASNGGEADEPDHDWTMYQGDLANTGYTPTSGPTSAVTTRWQYDAGAPIDTSPAVVDGTVYVGDNTGFVHAIDADNGDEVWTYDGRDGHDVMLVGTPTVRDGIVYAAGEQDFGSTGFTYAIDAATGEAEWKHESWQVHGSATVADGMVYVPTHYEGLLALRETTEYVGDLATLEEIEEIDDTDDLEDVENLEELADEHDVELETETGSSLAWTFDGEYSDTPTFAGHPAVGDALIVTGSFADTFALDAETGEKAWSYPAGQRSRGNPAIADGSVYFGHDTLYALDLESGSEQWTYAESSNCTSPAVADGTLYVGNSVITDDHQNYLSAIDAESGEVAWRTPIEDRPLKPPVVTDEAVYFASGWSDTSVDSDAEGGTVTALDRDGGDELWSAEIESYITAAPVVSDGVVYVGATGGTVYAFEAA